MKRFALAGVAAVLATGCHLRYEVVATSESVLPPADSTRTIPHALGEAQQLVIDKLGMRGFTLVDRQITAEGAKLRFAGNRDFYNSSTIGSVFYATVAPLSPAASRVTLIGKPTVGHDESCPSLVANAPCVPIFGSGWGLSGREEAAVVRGVFAELDLDASMAAQPASCTGG